MMNAEQVRAMAPLWLQGGRNMVPAPYRNHPEILNYMANNNSVFNYESINQQARTALNGNIHNASSAVTPVTPSTSTVNYSAINAEANAALNRSIGNASSAVTPAPTSTVTRAAVELSDEALYTGMHVTDDGVGAALRGAGHNMPTPTPTPKPAVTVPTPVKAPFNPGSVPVTDLKNVKLDMATPKPAVTVPTPVKAPFNPGSVTVAELKNVKLNMATPKPAVTVPTPVKAPFNPGSVPVAELKNVKLDTEAINKVDDVAKGFNWKKFGKWAGIGAGILAVAGLIGWGISKLCKKDEVHPEPTPKVKAEPTPEVTPEPTPEVTPEPTPEVTPEPTPEVTPEPTPEVTPEPTPEVTPEPTPEVKPELKTEYEAQRGDGIWHIAERYLKDKYANEPDKFENLTTAEKNKKILDETLRIAELNNYELVERTINGKKQIVPNPTLHPGDKVKVQ